MARQKIEEDLLKTRGRPRLPSRSICVRLDESRRAALAALGGKPALHLRAALEAYLLEAHLLEASSKEESRKPSLSTPTKRAAWRIPLPLWDRLEKRIARSKTSVSETVRAALDLYLAQATPAEENRTRQSATGRKRKRKRKPGLKRRAATIRA